MTLSSKAAAFSIDALLSRDNSEDSDKTSPDGKPKPFLTGMNPCSILETALSKPQQDKHITTTSSSPSEIVNSVATSTSASALTTLPHDFANSFASIESRLRQISVRSPATISYENRPSPRTERRGITISKPYTLENPLTIPSFKIHHDSSFANSPAASPPKDFGRRASGHSTTSTQDAEMEEAFACLKYKSSCAAYNPLAVEQWVKSTLEFQEGSTSNMATEEEPPLFQISNGIKVTLINAALWKKFNRCGTEMILNRAGRRMFPSILLNLTGLDESAIYSIRLHIVPADGQRYKFINCQWLPVGKADNEVACNYYEHSDSPNTGAFWMKGNTSFSKLKITNNKENGDKNVVLNSMHKYIPRILIVRENRSNEAGSQPQLSHFSFPESSFIAVTAYQNEQITQLKIQNNPFAKAFRDADVAALLQNAHGLTPDMAYGEGYSLQHISRRGSSPDYRPHVKLHALSEPSECRRRSLPVTPYIKPVCSYSRPPSGFNNLPWYSKSEKTCRLPRDGESACSSISSLASQESGFGDYLLPMELSKKAHLTKSKSQTEVYSDKHRDMLQETPSGQLQIPGVGGSGSSSSLSAGDIYWTPSSSSRVNISASHAFSALQIRSPQISKRRLENVQSSVLLNLNVPTKRCRSVSPSRGEEDVPHQVQNE